ncbi:MAG: transposase, partial [Bacilli bacterium]
MEPDEINEYLVALPSLKKDTKLPVILNQRIINIKNGKVTFIAKDYRDRAIKKPVSLDGMEFLRRFTMHILP